ncbi:MAG: LptF/LptG family permease [Flavobacteriaceae bacterium]
MKIIDRYILKSYLTRLISVFAICFLIFIVQTFWLFIDELAGKGLDFIIILKFLVYYSPKLVPLVLPLSVLLASLMTFGTLAENYEFAAMKSTGISLQRAMRWLVIFHVFIGIGTYFFSNHVIPYGELKSYNLRKNLAKLKPALAIREGIFNEIGEINIKVAEKSGPDDRYLKDVIIHEKSPNGKNTVVIKAATGELKSETTDALLQLVLYDGNRYEEVQPKKLAERRRFPHAQVSFEKYTMNIDLSQFNNVDLSEERYTTTYKMQKADELRVSIDSLEKQFLNQKTVFRDNFLRTHNYLKIKEVQDSCVTAAKDMLSTPLHYMADTNPNARIRIVNDAKSRIRVAYSSLNSKKRMFFLLQKRLNAHKTTLNDKYTLIFGSIFLFLIGASLGAIIRKGGIGLPLVLSVLIFLTYHYIGLFGKNASEDNSIHPFVASWISSFIIGPLGVFFAYRASRDRGLMNTDFITVPIQNLIGIIRTNAFFNRKLK